jgi:hypothetical protein
MFKRIFVLLVFVLVTLVTQVGGLAFALSWLIGRVLPERIGRLKRGAAYAVLFVCSYVVLHSFVVPPLAARGGRVPLPCAAESGRPFAAAHPIYCRLDRHYVDARLVTLMTHLSRDVERAYPGTVTLFLDGNLPFLNGFPLLPHLSHHDGRKLDLAYYYADGGGSYAPGATRSPIGYWGFEQPGDSDRSSCPRNSWLTLRWDMAALQEVLPEMPLEAERTRHALRWLASEGRVERIFIEPYLAKRLGVSSPVLGFQGCRAARHDDHIHIQIAR